MAERAEPYGLSDDQLVQLVLDRFDPAKQGADFEALKVLAGRYMTDDTPESTVSRTIERAFKKHLVEVVPVKKALPETKPDTDLAWALTDRFGVKAHVITWPPTRYTLPKGEEDQEDLLAHALGASAAKDLAGYFRPKERIGIGAGRCCYRTAYVLRERYYQQDSEFVRVYALAGNFNVRSQAAREKNVAVDASLNAYRLTNAWLGVSCHLEPILAPALVTNDEKLKTYKADTWLGDEGRNKPRISIVGVGGLWSRLGVRSSYGEELKGIVDPSPLKRSLDRLFAISEESMAKGIQGLPPYQVVGDCANRLLVVPPPPGHPTSAEVLVEARELVGEINRHLLTVTESDLLSMYLRVVAGGTSKAHVLRALLRDPGAAFGLPAPTRLPIEHLYTDSACAQALLDLDKRF